MLSRGKTRKLDSRTEVCLFISYPKGTRGGIFYNPWDKKVFASTHATFLEHEYINDFKPHSKVLLEDFLEGKTRNDATREAMESVTGEEPVASRATAEYGCELLST